MIDRSKEKLLSMEDVKRLLDGYRKHAIPTCLLTGCFDCYHIGHSRLIEFAYFKTAGIVVVGLNSDAAVKSLKGESRPVNTFAHRAEVLAGLVWVRAVFEIYGTTVTRTIQRLCPDFWVKGSDYTLETLNQDERQAAEAAGTEIIFAPKVEGVSTTNIIERIRQ